MTGPKEGRGEPPWGPKAGVAFKAWGPLWDCVVQLKEDQSLGGWGLT